MQRVLFVCTGNICRSPLAHAVFEKYCADKGFAKQVFTQSAGTHAYHVGEQADPRTIACAARHGIGLDHPARVVRPGDVDEYDLILAMDQGHLQHLLTYCHSDEHRAKVRLFRDFDPEGTGAVPDPYYGTTADFEKVWQIVDRSTPFIFEYLMSQRRS